MAEGGCKIWFNPFWKCTWFEFPSWHKVGPHWYCCCLLVSMATVYQLVRWFFGREDTDRETPSRRGCRESSCLPVLDLLKAILLKFIIHDREGHVNNLTIRAHAAVARKVFLDTFPQVQDNVWTWEAEEMLWNNTSGLAHILQSFTLISRRSNTCFLGISGLDKKNNVVSLNYWFCLV